MSDASAGYIYQRDAHPNADMLADKIRRLHDATWALVTGSGMQALSLAVLSELSANEHVVVSSQLYGRSLRLLTQQLPKLGIRTSVVDTFDVASVQAAIEPDTRWLVVETLTNPMLRIANLDRLARLAHDSHLRLLVDNTFATPCLCQPLRHGADLVWESVSKMMNGHSDVMLGALCGCDERLAHYRETLSSWGLTSSPFDCWLALRGLGTMHLRVQRACQNASELSERLSRHPMVEWVVYPRLPDHPDRALVDSLFTGGMAGNMVTFTIRGGRTVVDAMIRASRKIPFCPSLGDLATTLSHPASTSHRGLDASQRQQLGITDGTIRLSVGTESVDGIWQGLDESLRAAQFELAGSPRELKH
jgi:cystathionine beta-lyase/cystathionine gamma-synthase